MEAVVAAFIQEKALVGAFSVIVKTDCGTDGLFYSTNSGHCNEDKVAPTYVILAGGEAAWVLVLSEERRW